MKMSQSSQKELGVHATIAAGECHRGKKKWNVEKVFTARVPAQVSASSVAKFPGSIERQEREGRRKSRKCYQMQVSVGVGKKQCRSSTQCGGVGNGA